MFLILNNTLVAQILFEKKATIETNTNFHAVKIADMNNDEMNDLVAAKMSYHPGNSNNEDARIYIYYQDSMGNLINSTVLEYPRQYPGVTAMEIADLNNDNLNDIVIAVNDWIAISYQDPIGTFSVFDTIDFDNMTVKQLICRDINNDSLIDIAIMLSSYDYQSIIFYQNDTGLVQQNYSIEQDVVFRQMDLGDFNNDNYLDIVYHSYVTTDTNIYVIMNDSGFDFNDFSMYLNYYPDEYYKNLDDLIAGDYNNDGYSDIIGMKTNSDYIYLWENSENGFIEPSNIDTYYYSQRIIVQDMNCDGLNEIITLGGDVISVHNSTDLNHYNNFSLQNPSSPHYSYKNGYSIGDINNDNKLDIAICFEGRIIIAENISKPTEFSEIDTIFRADTSINFQDTTEIRIERVSIADFIENPIIYQIDTLSIFSYYSSGYITTDTMFIRETEFCGGNYIDTVFSSPNNLYFTQTIYDTTIYNTTYVTENNDTLALLEEISCDYYTSPSGDYTWFTSGVYIDYLPSSSGGDSLIIVDLTIQIVDTSVTIIGNSLVANATDATFQWLDCNGYTIIDSATNYTFEPFDNGYYAVQVTQNGCDAVSDCFLISTIGLEDNDVSCFISLYPNPTHGSFIIEFANYYDDINIRLRNVTGKVVSNYNYKSAKRIDYNLHGQKGLYFLEIKTNEGNIVLKVIKN